MAKDVPTVRMSHPKVKRDADVPVSAVPFHERSGWRRVDAKPAAAEDKPAVKAPAKNDKEGDG